MEYMAAARSPPELLPANSQLRLPRAIQRMAFSAMLLSASSRGSVAKRVSALRRLTM
jgi:hypothetical protein